MKWTPAQNDYLEMYYGAMTTEEIAVVLKRTKSSVRGHLSALHIRKAMPEHEKKQIVDLYQSGKSIRNIGIMLHHDRKTIRAFLLKSHVPIHTKGGVRNVTFHARQRKSYLDYWREECERKKKPFKTPLNWTKFNRQNMNWL